MPRPFIFALLLAAAMPLAACAKTPGDAPAGGAELAARTTVTVRAGTSAHQFRVEVARTPQEQSRGLMYRTSLGRDGESAGMLFPFTQPRIASFWMKDTYIPLDIFFIRADGSIDRIAENTIPESLVPIVSGGEVTAVLELAGGTAARLNIDESATITW